MLFLGGDAAQGERVPEEKQNWLKHWDWSGESPVIPEGWESHPVRWVSRRDAEAYCRYYDKRLPTSWEWQLAAQGRDTTCSTILGVQRCAGRTYPWGNAWSPYAVANLSNARTDPPLEDVGSHPASASPFGVEDLVGHVWQWTDEACDEHTCKGILRGGSNYYPLGSRWYFPQPGCVKGACRWDTPRGDLSEHNTLLLLSESMDRAATIGFRCVADAEPPSPDCPSGDAIWGSSVCGSGSPPPAAADASGENTVTMAGLFVLLVPALVVLWRLCNSKKIKQEGETESIYTSDGDSAVGS